VVLALHASCPPGPTAQGTRYHGRCASCPARLGTHSSGGGASFLSCGDVEANRGPPPPDWGEEDYAVLPDLVQEACSRLGIALTRDAFATPTNRRWVGLRQPDDLGWKRERRAREVPQAGFESHADWNRGINPLPSNSLVGHRIERPMVSAVLH